MIPVKSREKQMSDKAVREKLAARGVESLSDAELVSIIIHEGANGQSAIAQAEGVLAQAGGNLSSVSQMGLQQLRMCNGLGIRKSAQIVCALELGRRVERERANNIEFVASNDDVAAIFRPIIGNLPYEEFWVVYLTGGNRVLEKVRVGQGGVNGVPVDNRLVVKRAIELLASGMILVHNHPSGILQPSQDDIDLTNVISRSAALFDIALHDHIILTKSESLSFRFLGLL